MFTVHQSGLTTRTDWLDCILGGVFFFWGYFWTLRAIPHFFETINAASICRLVISTVIIFLLSRASAAAIAPAIDSWITSQQKKQNA